MKYNKNTESGLSLSSLLKISIVMTQGAIVSNRRSESLYGHTGNIFTPKPKKFTTLETNVSGINGCEASSLSF